MTRERTRRFLYAGADLIGEYPASTTTAVPDRRFVHGPGVDNPILCFGACLPGVTSGPTGIAMLADERGSIIAYADGDGNVVQKNIYGSFGRQKGGNEGTFRFTGQTYVPEIELYHYKARYYHDVLGRFLQTDPIGYEDQMNLYAYVGNDPVNFTDPTGLFQDEIVVQGFPNGSDTSFNGPRPLDSNFDVGEFSNYGGFGYNEHPAVDEIVVTAKRNTFRSNFLLRATVPGQISYDYAVEAYLNGEYLNSALFGASMFGEQVFAVITVGQGDRITRSVKGAAYGVGGYLGPAGPVFGRGGPYGRGAGINAGFLNPHFARIGFGYNGNQQVFRGALGHRGSPNYIHFDLYPPSQVGIGGTFQGGQFGFHPFRTGG